MPSWFAKLLIKLWGWKQKGCFPPQEVKKYVLLAAPQTSSQDLFIDVFTRVANKTKIGFLGKAALFKFPQGIFLKWLEGIPVDRSSSSNKVDAVIKMFESKEEFAICLAPEGTRQKVEKLRSGFYHIARGAKVPLVLCTLDFENKIISFSEPYYLTKDQDSDFKYIWNYFKGVKGKNPELSIN